MQFSIYKGAIDFSEQLVSAVQSLKRWFQVKNLAADSDAILR